MRRKNGQFISNSELVEEVDNLKNKLENQNDILQEYRNLLINSEKSLTKTSLELNKYKEKLNIFSYILRLTEAFLIPMLAFPFISFFLVGDLESAIVAIQKLTIVYCFACFVFAIFTVGEFYDKNKE